VGQIPKHPNTWYQRYTIPVSQFQAQYQHPNGCKEITVKILKTMSYSACNIHIRKMQVTKWVLSFHGISKLGTYVESYHNIEHREKNAGLLLQVL
jgi:hypothetical protein